MNYDAFFDPRSIAIIGARPEKDRVGYALMANLLAGKQRTLYPITPDFQEVLGIPTKASLDEVVEPVDLAIIAVRSTAVAGVLRQCGAKGIRQVIVISAGFKEAGEEGKLLEEELTHIAREEGILLMGPNCLGSIDGNADLNASFAVRKPLPGAIAVLSQSGAIGTALLDWSVDAGIGFSKFVSLGNEAGFSELDMLEYLGNDAATGAILMYLEHVSDGPRFLQTAKKITGELGKPIVVLRAGRSARGSQAVRSHTGSLAPEDAIFAAACRQAGVVTVDSLRELFDIAKLFQLRILRPLSRLAIVTNGGGPSVNAADLIELSRSLELVSFDDTTKNLLRGVLPPMAAVGNPVDVIGDAGEKRYRDTLEILAGHSEIDGIIVIITPQMMTDAESIARVVIDIRGRKPLIPILMGGEAFAGGRRTFHEKGIPNFDLPPDAIRALDALANGKRKVPPAGRTFAAASGVMLGYDESKTLLSQYGLDIVGRFARSKEELPGIWEALGARVVAMKAISRDVIHKTDANAIRLNIASAEDTGRMWDEISDSIGERSPGATIDGMLVQPMVRGKEVIVGMKRDAIFGPVVVFGLGGIFVEILKDVSMRVAPIDEEEAKRMMEEIAGVKYLGGYRGEQSVNTDALARVIASISRLAYEHPEISEIDLNPVMATPDAALLIDARLMVIKQ